MTTVSSLTGSQGSSEPSRLSGTKSNMDYDSFLKLFMAQMKNQDPTKPNDPTTTLSQLASFSNVEQSIRLNDKMQSLLAASNATLASSLVGMRISDLAGAVSGIVKNVTSSTGVLTASLEDGKSLNLGDGYRVGSP